MHDDTDRLFRADEAARSARPARARLPLVLVDARAADLFENVAARIGVRPVTLVDVLMWLVPIAGALVLLAVWIDCR